MASVAKELAPAMAPYEEGRTQGSILVGPDRSLLLSVPKALCDSKGVTIVMSETEGGVLHVRNADIRAKKTRQRYSCKSR